MKLIDIINAPPAERAHQALNMVGGKPGVLQRRSIAPLSGPMVA